MGVGLLSTETNSYVSSIVERLLDRKAEDIVILDISEVSLIADCFIVCTCRSNPHLKTVDEALDEEAAELGVSWHKKEGTPEAGWILHDFSSVIVHLFLSEQREYYSLERLWRDARQVPVESLLPRRDSQLVEDGGRISE
ncbi:MAG: ribosome silencing factor [Firmicutes bacterium]|jgi:ribosome-associated protein|nr:ribosome silencing factor [Bacillota bacterium]